MSTVAISMKQELMFVCRDKQETYFITSQSISYTAILAQLMIRSTQSNQTPFNLNSLVEQY